MSKLNRLTWSVFKLTQAFIPSLLICKVKKDLIETEGIMLMRRSEKKRFQQLKGGNSK